MKSKLQAFKKQYRKRNKELSKGLFVQIAKEASTIPAYAMRELSGQPHDRKPKCTLKKGWFEERG